MTQRILVCLPLLVCLFLIGCAGNPAVTLVQVIPGTATLNKAGDTAQLAATANFHKNNGTTYTRDVTAEATWTSSNQGIATVSSSGLVTAVAAGSATITATMKVEANITTGTAFITVGGSSAAALVRDLVSVSIIPTSQSTAIGQSAKFTAVGTFSSSPSTDVIPDSVVPSVVWDSSVNAVASINSVGAATPLSSGTTVITATATTPSGGKVVGTATLTVQSAPAQLGRDLLSISIIPTNQPLLSTGETAQFLAVGTFTNVPVTAFLPYPGTPATPTTPAIPATAVTWKSSATQVATIDAISGLATALGPGTTAITASAKSPNSNADVIGSAVLSGGGSTQVPLLTIVKLGAGGGAGTVTSNPSPIVCGSVCSASYPLGTTVTLTASPASSFRNWSSNCVPTTATSCTVTIVPNTIVGAIFD